MFARLTALHTKKNFTLAIATGNFFGEEDEALQELLSGGLAPPLPIYFTVGEKPLPASIVAKLSKDEEVRSPSHLLRRSSSSLCYILRNWADQPLVVRKPTLSREAKHYNHFGGHQNSRPRWIPGQIGYCGHLKRANPSISYSRRCEGTAWCEHR